MTIIESNSRLHSGVKTAVVGGSKKTLYKTSKDLSRYKEGGHEQDSSAYISGTKNLHSS